MSKANHIPDGYSSVTPVLVVKDVPRAIEFYNSAFGAKENHRPRLNGPGEKVAHAELSIGNSTIVVGDEFPEWGDHPPKSGVDQAVRISLHVEDVDETVKRAVAAGAQVQIPVADQFYGARSGRIVDPFGHIWIISTHKEDVQADEIHRRRQALVSKPPKQWLGASK